MHFKNLLFFLIPFFSIISCSTDSITTSNSKESSELKETTQSTNPSIISPDWYHIKKINYYNIWGLKITAMVKNDDVIEVSTEASNRSDYNYQGYTWEKSLDGGEYLYKVTVNYTLTYTMSWGDSGDPWAFPDTTDTVVIDDQSSNTSVETTESETTIWFKRSDESSYEYVADCINGHCPE